MNCIDPPSPAKKPTSISIWSLPHDVLLNCLARVSILYYPTLSLVSKNFVSIIVSSELYETRSRLNRTEKCMYLCLGYPFNPETYWFTLSRKPKSRGIASESSGYHMLKVQSPSYLLPLGSSSHVAVGSNIYKIGGADDCNFYKSSYSSKVSVLDCRSHTWHQAPSMRMNRDSSSTASLLDGKIYVAGGCNDKYLCSSDWIEVFDPKTQAWNSVKNPRIFDLDNEFRTYGFVAKSLQLEGKLYMFGDENVVYNPKEDKWNKIGMDHSRMLNSCHCVVDDVLFYWDGGEFKWYDRKVDLWKELNGVKGLPDLPDHQKDYCKMVDLGGKIGFLWLEDLYTTQAFRECMIWCAEISFERRDGDEILGKVEWFDSVLITSVPYTMFDVLSASL